jgi:beta-phosphoglucomutase-like phosphatase (HAD superfamily)
MATQQQAMFEAPVSQEAQYSNPYFNPEFEDEWEIHAAHEAQEAQYSNPYSNPEFEDEWETQEAQYSNPYSNPEFEDEWETQETQYSNPYANPEFEDEWETQETQYSNPYANPEFERETQEAQYGNPYANPENEGEYFFKKAFRSLGRGLKAGLKIVAPLAKRLAPIVAGKLTALIPGIGPIAGPLAAKLTSSLVKEGEMEAVQMEAEFFGTNEMEAEVAQTETAHEAALTEFLAAQAAEASTEAEAEAAIGASLPITISIMGGRQALRSVTPILSQANSILAQTLSRQGRPGRELLRTVPSIQRRAIATLKAAARSGRPINGATAVKAMASSARRVLGNPRTVQQAVVRNTVLRQRTAPPNPRRMEAQMGANGRRCPVCSKPLTSR